MAQVARGNAPAKQPRRPRRSDIAAALQAAEAMRLRVHGYTYDQIAETCHYNSRASAYNAVQRELERTVSEPAQDLRHLEVERLDALLQAFLPLALTGDHLACARVLDIMARRAKLLGLDAKEMVQHEIAGETTIVVRHINDWRAPRVRSLTDDLVTALPSGDAVVSDARASA